MTTILVTCRACDRTFAPDRQAILAGTWRVCPDCQASAPAPPNCIGPDCAVLIGHQIHRCSGCEQPNPLPHERRTNDAQAPSWPRRQLPSPSPNAAGMPLTVATAPDEVLALDEEAREAWLDEHQSRPGKYAARGA